MSTWQDEYLSMIEDCEKRESKLTDWERNFVESIRSWIEGGKMISANQVVTIERVWERVTKNG